MKKILFLSLLIFTLLVDAQNVGIGNANPAEKLDVNGNINVTGTIKANGVDGKANQVLMKNESGVLNWGDLGDYKNVAAFTDTSTSFIPWNVPAGITRIWVELWGGGGAGLFTGGGGGGYMSLLFNVTPAQTINITVGKGGKDLPQVSGSLTYNQSGGDSRIDIAGQYYIASGGGSAATSTFFAYPQYTPGYGGGYLTSVSGSTSPRGSFYSQTGQPGGTFRSEYNSISTTQYFKLNFYGDGGTAANTGNYTAQGAYEEYSVVSGTPTRTTHNPARPGNFPGGGGSGGPGLVNDSRSGANGLVLIHY